MADDISRRIDDLLSGAIDEQVREQRALNDTMIGVRDGVSRLVGDVAALSARVTESRETSQGLREELPFLVQREVSSAVNAMSVRIDVLETAVGELVASLAGLEDRLGPDVIIDGVTKRLADMRAAEEEQAGTVTAQAAKNAVAKASDALSAAFEKASKSMSDVVEKQHTQISRRLTDVKKWADDVEGRMKSLEKALEANVKLPADVRKQLNELTGATQDMTDSVLEELRVSAESAAVRISASVEGLDQEAIEMNRRFTEMNDAMRGFQEQMLAYLQVRDVALEERRDQIVTELLAEFFNEIPERDRERTVGRLRSVFARRRDRRDAERYRVGAKPAELPSVSPDAVARAQADLAREQRRAERPWAEPVPETRAPTRSVAPAPAFRDADDDFGDDFGDDDLSLSAAPAKKPAAKKTAAKKPAAKKTAAKKTAAKKTVATKKTQATPAADVEIDAAEDVSADESAFDQAAPIIVDTVQTGEIEIVDLHAFAEGDEADEPQPKRPAAKKKSAVKKPAAKKVSAAKPAQPTVPAAEIGDAADADRPAATTPDAPEPASESGPESAGDAGEDTLQQALARVQALVDQHRKPGGGRGKK